jgi:hypothetical protein
MNTRLYDYLFHSVIVCKMHIIAASIMPQYNYCLYQIYVKLILRMVVSFFGALFSQHACKGKWKQFDLFRSRLVGGKAGWTRAAHTDWNFTNLITPCMEERNIRQMYDALFDDALAESSTSIDSSSADSSSTDFSFSYSNVDDDEISIDVDCNEGELGTGPELGEELCNSSGIGSGNHLLNIQQLDNLLTSTACCKHCVKSSHAMSMDSFVTFCKLETK